ncbi:hypothetical protein [Deinococcus depolymerans]|uniref:Uncharacterized protein n=1 Tax=Deinococcus depolymerans TaxID=392408 RepID=A0ABP3MRD6_9DEIO
MKRFFTSVLVSSTLLTTSTSLAAAGAPAAPTPAPTVKVSPDGQWEYLVISFGKTYFSSAADIAAKQSGQGKLMLFGPLGGVVASEALDVQAQVDTLGRYGWELITVLGAIGGDQEWVFKRRFDPARAASEAAQIKKEGAALAAAREQAAKDAAAKVPATELVDLDAQEARAKRDATEKAVRDGVAARLTLPGWPTVKLDTSGLYVYSTSSGGVNTSGSVTVTLDATPRALSGNTYRGSQVTALIEEYLRTLAAQGRSVEKSNYSSCVNGGTAFKVAASVKFNGEWREVSASYLSATYCLK